MSLERNLQQFMGGDEVYRHLFGFNYSEGVKYLADQAGAYWLLDAIFSHQPTLRTRRLRDFQLWELTVQDGSAKLCCYEDSGEPPAVTQHFVRTNFPLVKIKFYFEGGLLMLPSER